MAHMFNSKLKSLLDRAMAKWSAIFPHSMIVSAQIPRKAKTRELEEKDKNKP